MKSAGLIITRANPPTNSFFEIVDKLESLEVDNKLIYLSHHRDSDNNPLDYSTKLAFLKTFINEKYNDIEVVNSTATTIKDILKELSNDFSSVKILIREDKKEDLEELIKEYKKEFEIKEIIDLVDKEAILNSEMLSLGKYIANSTLCSLISAYQTMLPKAYKANHNTNIAIKKVRYLVLNKKIKEVSDYIENTKYIKQQELLEKIIIEDKVKINSLNSTINTLIKHGLIRIIEEEENRYHPDIITTKKEIKLNEQQEKVTEEIINSLENSITYLLYGITGSGKTELQKYLLSKFKESSRVIVIDNVDELDSDFINQNIDIANGCTWNKWDEIANS